VTLGIEHPAANFSNPASLLQPLEFRIRNEPDQIERRVRPEMTEPDERDISLCRQCERLVDHWLRMQQLALARGRPI
jgi:hypothetical protein